MKKAKTVFVAILMILIVISAIVLHIFLPDYTDSFLVFIIGILMCIAAVSIMIDSYNCKTKVSAILMDYGFEQFKAHVTSSPVFFIQLSR